MDFEDILIKRSSIRSFQKKILEETLIEEIIHAIIQAPSAGNLQAYSVYVIKNPNLLEELSNALNKKEAIRTSSLCMVFCAKPQISEEKFSTRGRDLYCIQDATIAATYCQLAVTNLELASVWIGNFEESTVQTLVNIPENERPIAIIAIGYPNEIPYPTKRKPLEEILTIIE